MPQFMDFHHDLKLPAEAIAQIADDARHARAIRRHHTALEVPCGDVHQVNSLVLLSPPGDGPTPGSA